jgi:hypothetical protein
MYFQNKVAYYARALNCASKMFMKSTGANVIILFTAVSYDFSQLARVFVRGKPFQPSLMFAGKAKACSSEAPFKCSSTM